MPDLSTQCVQHPEQYSSDPASLPAAWSRLEKRPAVDNTMSSSHLLPIQLVMPEV